MTIEESSIAERLRELTNGRFLPDRIVGAGAFGTVVRAFDAARDEWVAVKVLHRTDASSQLRFKEEFRALAEVRHVNLVELHELFVDGEGAAFSMELLDGSPLHRLPSCSDEADAPRARAILEGLVAAAGALHDRGLLHRDIKPSNVVVTSTGRVVLLDYGLLHSSRSAAAARREGFVGTPGYLAPECLEPGRASVASDAYAVGAVIYEHITGRTPYVGTALAVLRAKAEGVEPDLGPVSGHPLEATVRALLAGDPWRREVEWARLRGSSLPCSIDLPFVGRSEELERVRDALAASRRHPVLVPVVAEAGLGKSAFLDAAESRLRAEGALVLRGRADARESIAYDLLDGVVDGWVAHRLRDAEDDLALPPSERAALERAFPTSRGAFETPGDDVGGAAGSLVRELAAQALRRLLDDASRTRPVAILLDDVHAADGDCAPWIERILAPPHAPRVLWVATLRPSALRPGGFVESLGGTGLPGLGVLDTRRIELSPLARDAADALVRHADPTLTEVERAGLVARCGGHPLALVTVVARASDGPRDAQPDPMRPFDEGFEALTVARRALLRCIAVRSGPVPVSHALRVAAASVPSARDVDTLVGTRWLRRSVRADSHAILVEPAHDLVRTAVRNRLTPDEASALARRWADVIAPGDDPLLVADVWASVGRLHDAVALLRDAAESAARGLAALRAVELLEAARALAPQVDDDGALSMRIGEVLSDAGRAAEAALAFARAARANGVSRSLRVERLRFAAEHALRAGDLEHGRRLVDAVLSALGLVRLESPVACVAAVVAERARLSLRGLSLRPVSSADPLELARADAAAAVAIGLSVVDSVRAAAYQSISLRLSLDAGDGDRAQRALAFSACFAANAGLRDVAYTDRLLDGAWSLARRSGAPVHRAHAVTAAALVSFHRGRFDEARRFAEDGARAFRALGGHWWKELVTAELYAGLSAVAVGEVAVAREVVARMLPECNARGDRYGVTNLRSGLFARLHLFAGDYEAARDDVSAARRGWRGEGYHVQHFFDLLAQVDQALYVGDHEAAERALSDDAPRMLRSGLTRSQWIRIHRALLEGRVALAASSVSPSRCRAMASAADRIAAERAPWAFGHVEALRAAVAARRGEHDEAARGFTRAALAYRGVGMAIEEACCTRALGTLRGHHAIVAEAEATLRVRGLVDLPRSTRIYLPL